MSNDDSLDWKNYGVKYTAQALDDIIKELKEKGYEIVSIFKHRPVCKTLVRCQ